MKKIYRALALLLSLAAVFGMASCGSQNAESTAAPTGGPTLPVIGPIVTQAETAAPTSGSEDQTEETAESSTASESSTEPEGSTEASAESTPEETRPTEPESTGPRQTGKGFLVCIDAGHQATDDFSTEPLGPGSTEMKQKASRGATGGSRPEYEVNLDVALKLKSELEARGYQVIMTRVTNDVHLSNVERAEFANKAGADVFLRLHCDSSELSSWNGFYGICMSEWNAYNAALHDVSRELCQMLAEETTKLTGAEAFRGGVVETDTMVGINWCECPVSLVEMGFVTNPTEDKRLNDSVYQGLLAKGMANGIDRFLEGKSPKEHHVTKLVASEIVPPVQPTESAEEPAESTAGGDARLIPGDAGILLPQLEAGQSAMIECRYQTDARYTQGSNGRLAVIDAGHQGKANTGKEPIGPGASETKTKVSSGTQGRFTNVAEHEVNLKVALLLEAELVKRGYSVLMVRTSADVNISNVERATMANDMQADVFIRIHCNGVDNASVEGCGAICQSKSNVYVGSLYNSFFGLSNTIVDEIVKLSGQKKYGVIADDTMAGINWCRVPTALIEMGFMTNEKEDRLLVSEAYQQQAALGMANGIDRFLGR